MMPQTVLFVDDEPNVLNALKRLFRKEGYNLLFARSGKDGLALMEEGEKPAVIISDQRMPEMNGAEFLSRAKEIAPDSVRLMLTGYSDIHAAMDAINQSGLFRYILKPWNDDDLKRAVGEAVFHHNLVSENRRLTRELIDKNEILEDLNANLEQKVKERTRDLNQAYKANLALLEKLRMKVRELKGRDRILQHLLTIHPLEETLQTVVEVICDVVRADVAAIHLPQEEGHAFLTAAAMSPSILEQLGDRPFHLRAVQQAYTSHEIVRVDETGAGRYGESTGLQPFVVLPVLKDEQCLAIIEVDKHQSGHPLSDDEMEIIEKLRVHIAMAISDSQIQEDLPVWEATLDDVLRNYSQK